MKKTLINILKSSLFGILLFGVISCDNIFSNKVSDTENTETLLKISVDDTSFARTLYPSSDASLLSDFTLTCTREGFTTKTKTAADLDALKALVINFADGEEGSWQIQLEASYEISSGTNVQAIAFSDTQSVNVQKNKLNEVSFKLTTENLTVGGLNIKVSFSGSADRVVASLKDETKETSIDEKTFTTSDFTIIEIEDEKSITFTRSISDTSEALTSGTYYLLFSFYDTTLSSETPLNTLPNYVRIVKGLTTSAELSISLNEVYTITYEDNGGTLASGAIKTGKYSRKSIVTLPQMEKEGYIFAGWYESSDFSGTPVTKIEKGSSGNKTFFARFVSSTLFVSQTGNNENDGMTASTALASVNKAVEKIISYGNIAAAYTIKISGTITGGVNIASTLTTEMASSLTLEGVTGKTGDTWVDVLDGGFTADNTGTTLTLSTKVPVIIKNLKITGGYARDSGGIELYAKSFLTMDSGEISGNTGLDHAGGVYLHHGNGTWNVSSYTNVIPGAVFTMNGGTICNNTGEGITLYDGIAPGEFNMNGGTITGNSGYGVNIVNSASGSFGKFTMKGDAVVAANNKVFLGYPGSTKIYIAGELTESAPVATVSLNGYNENTEIVALAEGITDTSLLSAACAKIEVAPYNGTPWYLTSDGKITSTDPNGGGGGDPSTWTGSADGHDYVDLGLPSGTLWATMNVGATVENRYYGDYFSWGETEPRYTSYTISRTDDGYGGISEVITVTWKTGYEEDGYKWNNYFDGTNGENFTIFKDADSSELDATHDAATVNWGANWKTPTKDQCSELINNCFMTSTNDYNNTGIAGIIVYKAFAGDEGEDTFGSTPPDLSGTYSLSIPHLFFPLCGRFPENNFVSSNNLCAYLWSSTLEPSYPETAYQFSPFNTESYDPVEFDPRANGEPVRPVYVGSTGGNGSNSGNGSGSNSDDFVTVTGGTFSTDGHVGTVENDNDAGTLTIPNLEVCSHLVTQYEYEQLMTYYGVAKSNSALIPTETSEEDKKNTPAYFVTWLDAIVYCNLLSESKGLTPVYSLSGNNEITEADSPWTDWGHIAVDGNGKYYYDQTDLESHDDISTYDLDAASFSYDLSANGYRLPTTAEYQNIKTKNPALISGEYDEWCQNYYYDYKRCMYDASETKPVTDIYADTRENKLGFRVVRNAGANGGSNP